MNERIKELAADAGYPDHMTYGQDKVLEKFAELIVRECAEHIDFAIFSNGGIDGRSLKEHFGVEE